MLKTGNHRSYAESRVRGHLSRFYGLLEQALDGKVDPDLLAKLEGTDNLFPGIDYRCFGRR